MFRNFIIHQIFSEFLQPLRDLWIKRVSPFLQQRVFPDLSVVLFFFGFESFFLAWSTSGLPDLSSTVVDTVTGEASLFYSILSFSSPSITYCRWWRRAWRRCGTMTLLSWKCPWSWRTRSWTRICWQAWNHNRNDVLRVALYPNPVLKWDVVFDHWSIHKNIRFHRKAFRATILLACFRGLS